MAGNTPKKHRTITVLISGSGTNLRALINACYHSSSSSPLHLLQNTSIAHVIYNRRAAERGVGYAAARELGVPTTYHNLVVYEKEAQGQEVWGGKDGDERRERVKKKARERYDADAARLILADKPSLVVLAGFMHVVSAEFLDPLKKAGIPVINLHPALPGQYNGTGAIERQYEDFQSGKIDKVGIMVHYVIEEVDMGTPICTREVPIYKSDTLEQFEERLHEMEWELIVEGTRKALDELEADEILNATEWPDV